MAIHKKTPGAPDRRSGRRGERFGRRPGRRGADRGDERPRRPREIHIGLRNDGRGASRNSLGKRGSDPGRRLPPRRNGICAGHRVRFPLHRGRGHSQASLPRPRNGLPDKRDRSGSRNLLRGDRQQPRLWRAGTCFRRRVPIRDNRPLPRRGSLPPAGRHPHLLPPGGLLNLPGVRRRPGRACGRRRDGTARQ